MDTLSKRIEKLSSEELTLFKEKLLLKGFEINDKNEIVKISTNNQIPEVSTESSYALSHAQKRLWILDQLEEDSIAYNIPGALVLEGDFNKAAFEKAFTYIIDRHEALRTVFVKENEEVRQKILEKTDQQLDFRDLTKEETTKEIVGEIAKKNIGDPFNLEKGPLVRFKILKIKDGRHHLLFNMHHIISDGWSIKLFTSELLESYLCFRKGKTPDLAPLKIQYKDFSAWQNDLLEGSKMAKQKQYWLDKMSGQVPVLDLPADKTRPLIQTYHGNREEFFLGKEISANLNSLCKAQNVSLFMMLQALFKVLFHRYTGQEDIIIGAPVAGRVHKDLENQIGFYANTIVFKDTIHAGLPFDQFLKTVKKTCTDAFENQEYPFDKLVEDLDIKRDLSRSPLFDVMLVLQNMDEVETVIEIEGLKISPLKTENIISKFDLTLVFAETSSGLQGMIEYNTDIYHANRIKRLTEHFKTLVEAVIEHPASLIADLEILPAKEKHRLLNLFNQTTISYSQDKSIVDLFEDQVLRTPDHVALKFEKTKVSYRELNQKANAVAHFLIEQHKIRAGDRIAILLPRSIELIAALIGIIKTGAAYVPIDVDLPDSRIDSMLADSQPVVIFGSRETAANHTIERIDIHRILSGQEHRANPNIKIELKTPFHLIYTSGSTGRPKGILASHKNVLNFLYWAIEYYFKGPNEGNFALFSSVSFDFVTSSIFLSLLRGKTLEIFGQDKDIGKILREVFASKTIDCPKIVPSHIPVLKDFGLKNEQLKMVLVSGEELLDHHVQTLREINPDLRIYNGYGPTETTMYCVVKQIGKSSKKILVGKPIHNTTIYVLNQNQPAPIGVPGEVCIAGDGVAEGYLNLPEVTREKFVDDVIQPNRKMYRTGDLACWHDDGNIEYLGRIDNQLKVRGYRIEPGEIENVLLQKDSVESVVVVDQENATGNRELVAYLVSKKPYRNSELRDFLGKTLPDYMIPSHFIFLETFPYTSNGKIDRKSLPKADFSGFPAEEDHVAPTTEIEKKLADIWKDILGIEQVGITDDFFDLGAHSLKAIKLINQIHKTFGVEVALNKIFENPTIENLSQEITIAAKKEFSQIEPVEPKAYYAVSNAQKRLWILDQIEESSIAYNMPAAFYLKGTFDEDALNRAIQTMMRRHESLRTVFIPVNGEPKQKIVNDVDFKTKFIDLTGVENTTDRLKRLAQREIQTPFDLQKGPLIRFSLVRLRANQVLLFFNMHHIISDGWSMGVLTKELLALYQRYKDEKPPALPPLTIQYKDYSAWHNRFLESDEIEKQKEYWHKNLSGSIPVLNLPADHTRPVAQSFSGSSLRFNLSKELSEKIHAFCQEQQVSLFMMLQALIKVLFYRYTGQADIILGSPIAGRNHEALDNQIGFYVNTLVLRDCLDGDDRFDDFLQAVKDTCTAAFENQDYPFDKLVEELDIKRDISRSPLFDVMLILQNIESTDLEVDELEITPYPIESIVSKFDMTFSFTERAEGLVCRVEYNTDIYDPERIQRLTEHFQTLVTSVLISPESKICRLDILPEKEKKQLLCEFKGAISKCPHEKTIVGLFETQVRKAPNQMALVSGNTKLTYQELNKTANALAWELRKKYDVKNNDRIGIMLDKSADLIIALLGINKTGAATLIIDPAYPEDRINTIVNDSRMKLLLSSLEFASQKQITCPGIITTIDDFDLNQSTENPQFDIDANDSLYLVYTSGTTGVPKGVLLTHQNLVNLIDDQLHHEIINYRGQHISQVAGLSFDVIYQEIYTTLLAGATLFLVDDKTKQNPDQLFEFIRHHKISIVFLPTAYLKFIAKNDPFLSAIPKNLDHLIVAGEQLTISEALQETLREQEIYLHNQYGPAETHVVTSLSLDHQKPMPQLPSIGKPIQNTSIYILDAHKQLQPIGTPGELWIAGNAVGKGYLNRDRLTREKFQELPFNNETAYRTGDLAKWLPDGTIEYLGRIDNQVKVRGFRIEPGEIENTLLQQEAVESAAVITMNSGNNENELAAYFTSNTSPDLADIKSFLKSRLPHYMIPSYFVQVDALPLTRNGKLDKDALPDPLVEGTAMGTSYVPPGNEIECLLVEIWQEVLGLEKIGIYDNFFDLGGNSLKAIQCLLKFNEQQTRNVSVSNFFKGQTIAAISGELSVQHLDNWSPLVTLLSADDGAPMYCIPGAAASLSDFNAIIKAMNRSQSIFGLQHAGLDPSSKACESIPGIAEENIKAMSRLKPDEPLFLMGHSFGGYVALEMACKLEKSGQTVGHVFLLDTIAPFFESGDTRMFKANQTRQFYENMQSMTKAANAELALLESELEGLAIEEAFALAKSRISPGDHFITQLPFEDYYAVFLTYQTHLKAILQYKPEATFCRFPITLFRAEQNACQSNVLNWDQFIRSEIDVYPIPGDHYTMLKENGAREIAKVLTATI